MRRINLAALRKRAGELYGKFLLYDYASNDIRESWLEEAKKLRKRADRIAQRRRKEKRVGGKK